MESRPVPEFPGYHATKDGQIIGKKGRPLKGYVEPSGYRTVALRISGSLRTKRVHVLMALAWHGPKPSPSHEVAHNSGVKADNSEGNIRWATPKENGADTVLHGKSTQGIRHPQARLNDEEVINIRAFGASGVTYDDLGLQFGLSPQHAWKIMTGRLWSHLPGAINDRRKPGPRPRAL